MFISGSFRRKSSTTESMAMESCDANTLAVQLLPKELKRSTLVIALSEP